MPAFGFARLADIPPVQDQPVVRALLEVGGRRTFQPGFDLVRRLAGG